MKPSFGLAGFSGQIVVAGFDRLMMMEA